MVHVLELEVSRGTGHGNYVVQVVSSPAGEASATFTLDSDRLLNTRAHLQNAVLASAVSSRRIATGNEGVVQAFGRELFDTLFESKPIAGLYTASRALANDHQEELRIVIRAESPELAALPWEVMYDAESDAYVCLREPLVRHVPVAKQPAPLRVHGAVRILGIVSSPNGLAELDVEKEKDNLVRAIARPAARGLVDLRWAEDATWSTLQELLLSEEWHVIHFIGHGDFDFEREEGILALVGRDGRPNRVEGSRFVDLLRQARPMPRLVVLNSCSSAMSSAEDLFSGTAAALVRGGVSAVAAMQFAISDDAAIEFCRGFYNAIAHGRGVDEAVGSGRVAILGSSANTLEWVTPVLYLRGRESHLFVVGEPERSRLPAEFVGIEGKVAQTQEALNQHDAPAGIPPPNRLGKNDSRMPEQELPRLAVNAGREDPTHPREDGKVAEKSRPAHTQGSEVPTVESSTNLARIWSKAKDVPWLDRVDKSALTELSRFLQSDESVLGVGQVRVPLAAGSFTVVVTDKNVYLSAVAVTVRPGMLMAETWATIRSAYPRSFSVSDSLLRLPLSGVDVCEFSEKEFKIGGGVGAFSVPSTRSSAGRNATVLETSFALAKRSHVQRGEINDGRVSAGHQETNLAQTDPEPPAPARESLPPTVNTSTNLARLWTKAKELPWLERVAKSDLTEVSQFLQSDEFVFAVGRVQVPLAGSLTVVITDENVYLSVSLPSTPALQGVWARIRNAYPDGFTMSDQLVRAPLSCVDVCEFVEQAFVMKGDAGEFSVPSPRTLGEKNAFVLEASFALAKRSRT